MLYQKVRPTTLDEVSGLGSVKTLLKKATQAELHSHVFLLSGPSGCGKTTLARILSREFGCDPQMGIMEINAAESRGIDTIRQLESVTQTPPFSLDNGATQGRAIILDECFTAGTPVTLADGSKKPIEKIRVGDVVRNLTGTGKVECLFSKQVSADRLLTIKFDNGQEVSCTKDHLFWTEAGWVKAAELKKGLLCLSPGDSKEPQQPEKTNGVGVTEVVPYEQENCDQRVFDLQVSEHPSYVVNDVFVHNCHMLTKEASNALLKLLEDVPTYQYWFLCTTDPQKVIKTIQTRCDHITVSLLSDEEIGEVVDKATIKLGWEPLQDDILWSIVDAAQGCARSALVLLERVHDLSTEEALAAIQKFQSTSAQTIDLCRAVVACNWKTSATTLKTLMTESGDAENIRRALLGYLRACLYKASGRQASKFANMIRELSENTYDSGDSGLLAMIYFAIEMGNR
jgi:DNA polymerase III gamma/tau subunit